MSDLGLKTLELPSKDRASTAGNEEHGCRPSTSKAHIITPYTAIVDGSSATGAASPLPGEGTETESEEEEEEIPPAPDGQQEMDYSGWKMEVKFLLNEKDVEPNRNGREGGGETVLHQMSDNYAILTWKEDVCCSKKILKKRVSTQKATYSNGGGADDFETVSSSGLASPQWSFWDDDADGNK